jgi:hypothetical protein
MVNLVIIMKRKQVIFQQRFNLLEQEHQRQQDGSVVNTTDEVANLLCRDYNFGFLVRETIRTFLSSFLVSIALYHTVEWPFRRWHQHIHMPNSTTTASSKKVS